MLPSTEIFRGTASNNFCFSTDEKDFYRVQLDQQRKAANIMLEIAQRVHVEWKMHLKRNRNSRPVEFLMKNWKVGTKCLVRIKINKCETTCRKMAKSVETL